MKQNIYDNQEFFRGYNELREMKAGLNEALEHPALFSLFPDVQDAIILDLGCGMGDLCKIFADNKAQKIIGVDISDKMLQIAKKRTQDYANIQLFHSAIEDFETKDNQFDLVVSSLALHYVQDIKAIFIKIHGWLKESGMLVFSIEHPIATCIQGLHQGWQKDENGNNLFWQVDAYSEEGIRKSNWFVDDVVKYHRTMSTILNSLIISSFRILKVLEPYAKTEFEMARPALKEEKRRPPFLLVLASKN